jgi:hypothetical protein
LIQGENSTKSALPVKRRTVTVVPFTKPVISQVLSISNTNPPIQADQPILPGYSLVLQGSELMGIDGTIVQIGDDQVAPNAANATPTTLVAPIPSDLLAGTQTVQVIQPLAFGAPATDHDGFSSDPVTFVLRPVIQKITVGTGVSTVDGTIVNLINLTLDPPVGATQTVVLLLNQLLPPSSPPPVPLSYSFQAEPPYVLSSPPSIEPPPSPNVSVPYTGVVPGNYLVRVQVDGAESILTQDANGNFNGPQVTL